ncbi:MAG: hypothetical protein MPK11_04235, partial [Gammaproteobacteria bacterium]|nr:hypothetical protein [Gammaproteobacteria bacterium]
MKLKQFFAKTAAMLALLVAVGSVAHAQQARVWFTPEGQTAVAHSAAPATFDVNGLTPESDGSRLFKLEMLYGDDVAVNGLVDIHIHTDGAKVELISSETENIQTGASLSPSVAGDNFAQETYAAFETRVGAGTASDDSDDTTTHLTAPSWSAFGGNAFAAANDGDLTAPTRLATLSFKWIAGQGGDSKINVVMNGITNAITDPAQGGILGTITLNGPPVPQRAKLSLAFGTDGQGAGLPNDFKASAERATQAQGAAGTAVEVTCTLIGADGSDDTTSAIASDGTSCSIVGTAAVLGGAAGSATHASSPSGDTEYSGDDVTTAMVVNIPTGEASATATFELQSNANTATLQFDFRISAVEDVGASGTDYIVDQFSKASATFRIVDAALQLVALGTDGACSAS